LKARKLLTKVLVFDLENPDLLHEVKREISDFLKTEGDTLESYMAKVADEAETNAWKCLSQYKFYMFGYWAARWVQANKVLNRRNPFGVLVRLAKAEIETLHRLPCKQFTPDENRGLMCVCGFPRDDHPLSGEPEQSGMEDYLGIEDR
jgi:hypothetical protein